MNIYVELTRGDSYLYFDIKELMNDGETTVAVDKNGEVEFSLQNKNIKNLKCEVE